MTSSPDPGIPFSGPSAPDLERRILHGLRLEWESVLSFVTHPSRPVMMPPLFSLKDGEKSLAHWDSSKREISFSRRFVLGYPWDAVKEVLVHEMAHQYAHEVFKAGNEPPHGPSFRKACHVLKANPRASGSYRPLTDRLSEDGLSEQDRILVKVKKLLALGNSMNRNEAEFAVAKAHDLIRKYNLDLLEKDRERRFISLFTGLPALKHARHEYLLSHLLVEHYFVYGIWVPAYVISKGKMGRVFEITGTPENVKIASYVHDFITCHMERAWGDFNRNKKLGRSHQCDFSTGLVMGFTDRLNRERTDRGSAASPQLISPSHAGALVPLDPKLSEYASYRYPRVRHQKRPPRPVDPRVLDAGKDIGRKLVLNKAVETRHQGDTLFLPHGS